MYNYFSSGSINCFYIVIKHQQQIQCLERTSLFMKALSRVNAHNLFATPERHSFFQIKRESERRLYF